MQKLYAHSGFSLIELMIVVAIIGLLSMVAIPSYQNYIVRSNQADAKDKLSEVMFEMNRYAVRNRTFTIDLSDLGYNDDANDDIQSSEGFYTISAAACAGSINRCVALTATPNANTSQNGTGNFTLNSRGEKGFNGSIGGWGGNHH